MTSTATIPPPAPAAANFGWYINGQAQTSGSDLQLTAAGAGQGAGSAFYNAPLPAAGLQITFTTSMSGGSGGGGIALVLADPTQTGPTALGGYRGGFGFVGIPGTALVISTDNNTPPGSGNYAGITTSTLGATGAPGSYLATTTALPALRPATHTWSVTLNAGTMTVTCDGNQVLSQAVALGPTVLLGFTAANSARDDTHIVRNVQVTHTTAGSIGGVTVTGTPTAGQVPLATSSTAAAWTPIGVPLKSGWYYPQDGGGGSLTMVYQQLWLFPFDCQRAITLNALALNVKTAGPADAVIRMGVYSSDGAGGIGNLLKDAGTASAASSGVKTLSSLAAAAGPDRLWIGAVWQGTTTTGGPVVQSYAKANPYLGWSSYQQFPSVVAYTFANIAGALPASLPTPTSFENNAAPGVQLSPL